MLIATYLCRMLGRPSCLFAVLSILVFLRGHIHWKWLPLKMYIYLAERIFLYIRISIEKNVFIN